MNKCAAIMLSAVVVLGALDAGCSHSSNGATPIIAATGQTPAVLEVEVTRVVSQKLSATVRLPGQLVPYESVDLYPKVTGFVKWIKVDRGSRVKEGDPIAQLDAPELVAQRAEAESKYEGAESQLAGIQAKLAADQATDRRMTAAARTPGVVAANDLEIADKAVQSDQASVSAGEKSAQAARAALDSITQLEAYLSIAAPFDGQVTTRYVHPGALVGPQGGSGAMTPIVQIQTIARHRLVVPVPEYDAAGIPKGTEVTFSVPSFPEKVFRAPIARISGAVDLKTRTMPVELDVMDPRAEFDPGTYCDVQWPVRRAYATLFVPASAVATDLERSFVNRVRDGHIEWVDVKTGGASKSLVEVFGDLKEGDEVATHGTDQLRPGTEVKAKLAQ